MSEAARMSDSAGPRRAMSVVLRIAKLAACAVAIPLFAFVHLLGCLGVAFAQWPTAPAARYTFAALYALGLVAALIRVRPRLRTAAISLLAPLLIWLLYGLVEPKRDGRYPPETSRAARAEFDGERFTLRDVRNFEYRTETDFEVRFEDRSYDLRDVRTVDYVVCWWTPDRQIAHTMLSFGFADGRYLCCSIEIRREVEEIYGPIDGLYRRYELIYVWGDERDLIRLRTNYRGEDVCLYRTTCSTDDSRRLLEDYLDATNQLAADPAFYNTLQRNCTSCIRDHINHVLPRKIPWYARRLRNGFTDRRTWEAKWLVGDGEFEALQAASRIVERAKAADQDAAFSQRIRTHLK
jgi:Domain of unknown function (DUF4105)